MYYIRWSALYIMECVCGRLRSNIVLIYGAQNEAYMSQSAEKWVRGLCFNELGACD